MRIGIFTYGMEGTRMTGIARYAVELTRALNRLDRSIEIILLNPYPNASHPWYREFETYPLPWLGRMPLAASFGNWQLHRAARELQLDVLHDPCGIAPFLVPGTDYARVTTIHDAVPFIYPRTQPLLTRLVFETLVRAARYTADAVLTVSHAAADDLARVVGIAPDKLHVTHNGVTMPQPMTSEERLRKLDALGVRSPYLLYVGALHPRKNLDRVLAAYASQRESEADVELVIVGPPSWGAHATLRAIVDSSTDDSGVRFTGFVSDRDLDALYFGALALVFPSLYEGFGLPALEAMAHGTPVITSNTSSLPEVVGETALLVDPTSTAAIAAAMQRMIGDDDLRHALANAGLERAALFGWERCARATMTVYRGVVERR